MNIKMKSLIIIATIIGLSCQETTKGTTTHAPRTTHESSVDSHFIFHYDHLTHKMAVHMGTNCYIFTLSADDRADVHTDTTLRTLEIKLIKMIGSLTKTTVTKDSLEDSVAKACGEFVRHYYTVSEVK